MEIKAITAVETYALRHSVLWPDKPLSYVQVEEDDKMTHFGLFVGTECHTVISCHIVGDTMQFRKFATAPHMQKKGYGTAMMHHILAYAREKGVTNVWCNARLEKQAFYESFGMCVEGEKFLKEGFLYGKMKVSLTVNDTQ